MTAPAVPVASSAPPVYPGMAPVLHAQKKEEEQSDTDKDKDADDTLDLRTDAVAVAEASPALSPGGGGGGGGGGVVATAALPTPSQMVEKLDRYVVGQARAKKVRASPRLLPRATTATQSKGQRVDDARPTSRRRTPRVRPPALLMR